MDHLHFCAAYSALHYPTQSPRVLFLHSIMGVGTNLFPMDVAKWPQLAAMLTPQEQTHIQAFPSILRLILSQKLLPRLKAAQADGSLSRMTALTFRRVIDNAPLRLTLAELWVHLNFQLIHLLDFLPEANWAARCNDGLFGAFFELHAFLLSAGKLEANVTWEAASPGETTDDGEPLTLRGLLRAAIPTSAAKALSAKAIRRFSAACGHSLDFALCCDE